ncbi:MAG: presenilin family intramembrane aspartyl protease, partial [Methanoregula sp.]|nr:presenilin family intramembrane aspartyl protease [Methanoregula sp.]
MDYKNIIPFLVMPFILLAVEAGAILLSLPVQAAGITAFEDPDSVVNALVFIAILLVFTGLLLLLIKYNFKKVITYVIALSIFLTFCYIFSALVFVSMGSTLLATVVTISAAVVATIVLYSFPEWYVIDLLGILIAAGVAAIFGASLNWIPVVVLLALLAIYDAISVYKTKHMLTLADGVIDLKMPILFVIPKRRGYSYIREGIEKIEEGKERSAFIMGMGDLIMPALLVVSANVFLPGWRLFGVINIPALGAVIGSFAGLSVL